MKITGFEIFPVVYPVAGSFRFLETPRGPGRGAVFVKLTTDDGAVGWGQSVPVARWTYECLESAVIVLRDYLRPAVLGQDPRDLAGIHAAMNREICGSFSTGYPLTKAGVDLALHDLLGRATGRNVAELWGRPLPEELTLSWTVSSPRLEEIPRLVEAGLARGYAHFNLKVAPDPDFDVQVCRLVRRYAPNAFLWCDANGGYDLATALRAAPMLADLGIPALEQPLPINQISAYRRLREQGALSILLDEGMVSPTDLLEFVQLGCCDGAALKLARCGGLVPARAQAEILLERGLHFYGSGLTDPDLSLAGSLILFGAHGLPHPAALNGPQFLTESLLAEPLVPVGGRLRIPRGPGLGVTVDEEKLAALVARSRVMDRLAG
ncbi:MAG: mandelate racemase [Verrucomicrobia bacterium]|nr:mandelate racemase [Verrucomicrobiota bacterium]